MSGPVSIQAENSSGFCVVVGNGNRVDGRPVRGGPPVVRVHGERWVAVRLRQPLRGRVESWAREHGVEVADALATLAERGLDEEEGEEP